MGLCLIKRKERLHKAQWLKSLVLLRKCLVTSAVFHSSSMILFVVLSVLVIFFQENPIDTKPLLLLKIVTFLTNALSGHMSGLICLSNFNKACSKPSPNKYKSVAKLENFRCQDVAKQSAITKLSSPTHLLIEIYFYRLMI